MKISFKDFLASLLIAGIIVVGIRLLSPASGEKKPKKIRAIVTAYYGPKKNQKSYYTGSYMGDIKLNGKGESTSSGTKARISVVSADREYFPRGTILNIPGYGKGIVEDTGGRIKGPYRLEVFAGHGEAALNWAIAWGKRSMEIEIIE